MRIFALKNFMFNEGAARALAKSMNESAQVLYVFKSKKRVYATQSARVIEECHAFFKRENFDPEKDYIAITGPLGCAPIPLTVLSLMYPGRAINTLIYVQQQEEYIVNEVRFPHSLLPY